MHKISNNIEKIQKSKSNLVIPLINKHCDMVEPKEENVEDGEVHRVNEDSLIPWEVNSDARLKKEKSLFYWNLFCGLFHLVQAIAVLALSLNPKGTYISYVSHRFSLFIFCLHF